MKTLVLTVTHSGTHFLLKFLVGILGLHGNSDARSISARSNVDFAHDHPGNGVSIPEGVFDSLIITLRHPHKSTQTAKLQGGNTAGQVDQWQQLIEYKKQYSKVMVVVIDGPPSERFGQLMAIAKHFGKDDKVEQVKAYADAWEPVNQSLTADDKEKMQFAVEAYESWR